MVSASRVEGGTVISARVRKTIQSIREIVKGHSEVDIYTILQESNMDPNETAQKLLNQEPFHEVRKRRDKKEESMGYKDPIEPRKHVERVDHGMKFQTYSDPSISIESRNYAGNVVQGMKSQLYSNRNVQRGSYIRNTFPGFNHQEFRVVRDNRINHNTNSEPKLDSHQISTLSSRERVSNVNKKSSTWVSSNQRNSGGRNVSQVSNRSYDSKVRHLHDVDLFRTDKKEIPGRKVGLPDAVMSNDFRQHSATIPSNSSVLGVYSSSSDPVHVPSSDSQSLAAAGAIKREVGVVGNRRQFSGNSVKVSVEENRRQSSESIKILSKPRDSLSNPLLVRDISSAVEPYQSINTVSKSIQHDQIAVPDHIIPSESVGRSALSTQSNSRQQQQKASQLSKEWKPKSSKKSGYVSPGVIGVDSKCSPANISKDVKSVTSQLHENVLQVNVIENENVVIPQHIRVTETDRSQLTFGTFGVEPDSSNKIASEVQDVTGAKESLGHPESFLESAPEFPTDDSSDRKPLDKLVDHVRHSGSRSSVPGEAHVPQMADNRDSLASHNLENYTDIGMVGDNRPSYTPLESHQRPDLSEFQSFSQAYDPQTGYDIPYFRATMNEPIRRNDIPSPQESSSSHMVNSIPASTISLVQAPRQAVAQMYPQLHMSHFPIRQFISPLYVPPLAMSGYSNNPAAAYPHPSNASSYLLLPGTNSPHLTPATALKYGIQQFKPVPAAPPTAFGSFTNQSGYAINAPGVVGNAASALEDSMRLKYKDGNLYLHNLQGETSEIWVQNPREVANLQSVAPYYNMNMGGQSAAHNGGAYIPTHTAHASYNAAAAAAVQSSHMHFPTNLYHPPQQLAAIVGPHHLGPPNVGVGVAAAAAAPGSQLSHLNWPTNF